jgi:hypothetical protein
MQACQRNGEHRPERPQHADYADVAVRERIEVVFNRLFVEGIDLPASAEAPVAEISFATASTLSNVRPATNTLAPSRAKARATAPPMGPTAVKSHSSCESVRRGTS